MVIAYELVRPQHEPRPRLESGAGVRAAARIALAASLLCVAPASALEGVDDNNSALRMSKMTFVDARDGHTEVVLDAERVYLPPRSDVAQLEGIHVRMAQARSIGESLVMTCERGDMVLGRGLLGTQGAEPKVACPMHKKTFSLVSGAGLADPQFQIRTYPVEVRDGDVYVAVPIGAAVGTVAETCQTGGTCSAPGLMAGGIP